MAVIEKSVLEGKRTFALPLSDSDRSYLKMHAVRQGKSPNSPDDVLLAIWNGIDPQPLRKKIADITDMIARESDDTDELISTLSPSKKGSGARSELVALIGSLSDQMRAAADELHFELAARLRDEIKELKRELRSMEEAGIKK